MKTVRLDELVFFQSGNAWKAAKFNTESDGLPVIRIQNVDAVRESEFKYWNFEYDDKYLIKEGDLLLTLSGSFRVTQWSGPIALLNQRIVKLTPKDGVHLKWLTQALTSLLAEVEKMGRHSLVNNVALSDLKQMKLALPSLEEQKRIAGILDQADALRRQRQRALDHLNQLGQSIFYELFGDPAMDKYWEEIEVSAIAKNPKDIKCGPFGTQLHQSDFVEDGVPLWGIKQVNSKFKKQTNEFVTESKFRKLEQYSLLPDDIVMTRKGTVGNSAIYPRGFPVGVMHSDLLRLRVDTDRFNPRFVNDQFTYNRSFIHQLSLISGGAIMAGINVSRLKNLIAIAPPKELQDEYALRVRSLANVTFKKVNSLNELNVLFASLQQRAFRGEL